MINKSSGQKNDSCTDRRESSAGTRSGWAGLVGKCARLALRVDAVRLRQEVAGLPAPFWGSSAGRVGVHSGVQAVFLRGCAPALGDLPIEDREPLAMLPYTRAFLTSLIPAPAMRCLLARLGPNSHIAPHIDRGDYFRATVRLHVPVETNDLVSMVCDGAHFTMSAGEVWALNNSLPHAVRNAHSTLSRTHLICDFLPSPELLRMLVAADRSLAQATELRTP